MWILFNVLTGMLAFKTVIVVISAIMFFCVFCAAVKKISEVEVLIRKWVYIIHSFVGYESQIGWLHLRGFDERPLGCSTV